jgi:tetratricopeptide (TPR) repeat protein
VRLLDRTLARDPGERPPSMRAFADELGALLEGREAAIDRRLADRRERRRGGSLRTGIYVGAGAAVLIAGLVLTRAHEAPPGDPPVGVTARSVPLEPPAAPAPVAVEPPPVAKDSVAPPKIHGRATALAKAPAKAPAKTIADPKVATREAAAQEARRKLGEARQALQAGQFAQAETLFNQVRGMNLEIPAVTTGLAEVAFQRGDYGEAARIGRRAASVGGGVPARMVVGNALFKLGKIDEAIQQYQEILRIDNRHGEAKSNLKAALARKGG